MSTLTEDVLAIQNLKARYCAVADSAADDPEGALAAFRSTVFLPDVTADYGFDPMQGVDTLGSFLCTAIAGNSEWVLHMIHTPMIEIAGDTARGDWTVMAHLKRRETGEVDLVRGRYSDEFRRTPEGWRIARVTFTRLL
ncbi:nuclear transport factor 2 family protein [Caulobacter soli]|uniref:nuclear transport factor 2 family protein n=1 Tax=Caulobacter soli TaxID=2708539 RepID=UPI0013EAC448|nr:nuclear transport factor 2 family protein [Caulobacter soli]